VTTTSPSTSSLPRLVDLTVAGQEQAEVHCLHNVVPQRTFPASLLRARRPRHHCEDTAVRGKLQPRSPSPEGEALLPPRQEFLCPAIEPCSVPCREAAVSLYHPPGLRLLEAYCPVSDSRPPPSYSKVNSILS
jgi:hypothetical protein